MFRKVMVFGLLKMIQEKKKSEDRGPGSGFGLWVGSGTAAWAITKPMMLHMLLNYFLEKLLNCMVFLPPLYLIGM